MRAVEFHSFLTLALYINEWSKSRPGHFTLWKNPVSSNHDAGWTLSPVQTFWRREKFLFCAGIRAPNSQARSLVTTPTTVSRLLKFYYPHLYFYFSYFSCGLISSVAQGPSSGLSRLVFEVSISDTVRHRHRHTHTLSRTPLGEGPCPCRHLCLTSHNIHDRQTSMPPEGFEPTIPPSERPHTYALNRAATGIGFLVVQYKKFIRISANICKRERCPRPIQTGKHRSTDCDSNRNLHDTPR